MRISEKTISELTNVITGEIRISPYQSGRDLVTFFNQCGWNDDYAQGIGTRAVYVRDNLHAVNGTTTLRQVIIAVVDPRRFFGKDFNVEEVVTYLNQFLAYDGYELRREGLHYQIYRTGIVQEGQGTRVKNIIFAANGPKPEIVLVDAINNDIKIVRNAEYCLVYDREITDNGLRWREIVAWWVEQSGLADLAAAQQVRHLLRRLTQSLDSDPERLLFNTYYDTFLPQLGDELPVLVPQVYLHYDPQTVQQLAGNRRLPRQRMDFLLLLPQRKRVVIEIDGKQHYSEDERPSPKRYAHMVSEDRRLKLAGYDVYRFGGYEFVNQNVCIKIIRSFFQQLFTIHGVA
jgi:hypothetical protein